MKRVIKMILLLAVAVFMAVEADSGEPRTSVWDTCKRFNSGNSELNKRDGWQLVAPGASANYAFKGDAVIENDRLRVLFSPGRGGPAEIGRAHV